MSADAELLFSTLLEARGVTITYTQGNVSVSNVSATRGKSNVVVEETDGQILQVQAQDWIVRAKDLVNGAAVLTPAKGDKITFLSCGRTYTYQLMTPPWDPSSHDGYLIRLHSKQISVQ